MSINAYAQEYEINSDKVEINTELNTITYSNNVSFSSVNIDFEAEILNIDQNNQSFEASGNNSMRTFRTFFDIELFLNFIFITSI